MTEPRTRAARALVVFPGALGDLLLLAPALAALRTGGLAIELSVQRALVELAGALFPGAAGPPADGAAVATLFGAELHPELAAWLRGAARVDVWLGADEVLRRHAGALGLGRVRHHRVERGDAGVHASVAYAHVLEVASPLAMPPPPQGWTRAAAGAVRPLVIHPGAGALEKRWATSGFRKLADAWRARGGETTVLLGPAEMDDERYWRTSGHAVAAGVGLRDAAALIGGASWYVGNDSGMSHLAGLLERRGVVLFGATRAARWRPFGGALRPVSYRDVDEDVDEDEVVARVLAAGYLDTLTGRH